MTAEASKPETWRKGERLSPPIGSSRDIYLFFFAGVGIPLEENIGDRIIADHDAAAQLTAERERADRAEAALEQFEKAWALPPQGIGQVVIPSAGEIAADAVEEAKRYRAERDTALAQVAALRAALSRTAQWYHTEMHAYKALYPPPYRDIEHMVTGPTKFESCPIERCQEVAALLADTAPQPETP